MMRPSQALELGNRVEIRLEKRAARVRVTHGRAEVEFQETDAMDTSLRALSRWW